MLGLVDRTAGFEGEAPADIFITTLKLRFDRNPSRKQKEGKYPCFLKCDFAPPSLQTHLL